MCDQTNKDFADNSDDSFKLLPESLPEAFSISEYFENLGGICVSVYEFITGNQPQP